MGRPGPAALGAQADLIVSGDAHLLDLAKFQSIEIVTAATAVERIGSIAERAIKQFMAGRYSALIEVVRNPSRSRWDFCLFAEDAFATLHSGLATQCCHC